jgi:probable rRNA maturation factor
VSRLHVSITAQTGRAFVPFLRSHLVRAHRALLAGGDRPRRRSGLRELSVALVGDARMSDLHKRFMGIAGPTDVLTFPTETDSRDRVTSGEVVVCVPEAKRQAGARKIPVQHELLLYALHGMLHLLGYDDRTDRAFRVMHHTEDALMSKLGLGPVFARPMAPRPAKGQAKRRAKGGRP